MESWEKLNAKNGEGLLDGLTAFGESAGEMHAPVQLARSAGLPCTAQRDSIFTHPTFSEGLVYLFSSVPTNPTA